MARPTSSNSTSDDFDEHNSVERDLGPCSSRMAQQVAQRRQAAAADTLPASSQFVSFFFFGKLYLL